MRRKHLSLNIVLLCTQGFCVFLRSSFCMSSLLFLDTHTPYCGCFSEKTTSFSLPARLKRAAFRCIQKISDAPLQEQDIHHVLSVNKFTRWRHIYLHTTLVKGYPWLWICNCWSVWLLP
ncbi:hypothetical protein KP509_31G010400 [Ceratopteris richardii]|uniref:Uncharacterized protein n=1 Tax=Ceratopteris richardii TaxID=49495 RepID=A0A8T2QW19_CERRI|nr:hypothetical protein KP509_31G010400 [Ceratopteris richardii]